MSLNNAKNCHEISLDKVAICEITAGLRSGNSSDLDSACLKVLVPAKIFQFSDMNNENRFLDSFRGHNIRRKSTYKTHTQQLYSMLTGAHIIYFVTSQKLVNFF